MKKDRESPGSNFVGRKRGIVPRPAASGYCAGTVEAEGSKVVKIADSPRVSDRPHAAPSSGTDQGSASKSAEHGYRYPGRSYKVSSVEAAQENDGAAKRARAPQIASSGRLGN